MRFAPDMTALCSVPCILREAESALRLTMRQAPARLLLLMQDLCKNRTADPPGLIPPFLCNSPDSLIKRKITPKQTKARTARKPLQTLPGNFTRVQTLFFILCLEQDVNPYAPAEGPQYLLTPQVMQPSSCPTARSELLPTRHSCSSSTYMKQVMASLALQC